MGLIVATSKVADGSMYNRENVLDQSVIENRERFLASQNIAIDQTTRVRVNYDQEDFCRYVDVDVSKKGVGMRDGNADIADALVTTESHHALFLPIADCVGAVLYDPIKNILAIAHLGRHSLEQQGGQKIVEYLQKNHDANPKDIKIWLTPAPGKDAYPIWALDNKGMKEATFEQLFAAGILKENITDNPIESDKDPDYFSYSEFLKGNRTKDGDHAIVAMMTS